MNIDIKATLKRIEKQLNENPPGLDKAYGVSVHLRSQLLSLIHDRETFGGITASREPLAERLTLGAMEGDMVILTIHEPLPAQKEMTAAVCEHWINLMQAAIGKAALAGKLPYFEKAFVWIEVITPEYAGVAKLWDTSNRAVNLVINNLKGVLFEDDNYCRMVFGVAGGQGEKGVTIVRILPFDKLAQIVDISL